MKKRIVTVFIIMSMIMGAFCAPTFAVSNSSKYIKVKKTVYQKYKNAYRDVKSLIKENIRLNNIIDKYWAENENLKEELAECYEIIEGENRNENLNSDSDLTNKNRRDIIIKEAENRQTILSEREIDCIDYMALIDSYEEGEWYCYYICADGDCYTVTIKRGHVDRFVQLN